MIQRVQDHGAAIGEKGFEAVVAELREAEARQRALLEVIPDLMFRIHRNGTYLEFAGDLTRLATPPDELMGANMFDILPREVAGPYMASAERAIETGTLQTCEYKLRTLTGDLRDFEARIVRAGPDEVVSIVRDVTDLKSAEQELRESRARIVEAGNAERRRLERNLHDGAQQRLATINLALHIVERDLEEDPVSVRRFLKIAQDELAAALDEIRQLAHGLHPAVLAEEGLSAAVRSLVERSVVPVEVGDLSEVRLHEGVEATAYYVIAELVANAAKHADATRVQVSARVEGDRLLVEVADDGVGGADIAGGSGLRGLADRIAAVGGELEIESPAGSGTRARASLPTTS